MFAYPDYAKVPSVERLESILARLKERPEAERNEYASLWLRDLQQELTPKSEGPGVDVVERDVLAMVRAGRQIDAMKEARARLGIGFKEAHDYVRRLQNRR